MQPDETGLKISEQIVAQAQANCANIAPAKIYNQGVFNVMELPINPDYIAVGLAIKDLLREGWSFRTIEMRKEGLSQSENYYIQLSREWRC